MLGPIGHQKQVLYIGNGKQYSREQYSREQGGSGILWGIAKVITDRSVYAGAVQIQKTRDEIIASTSGIVQNIDSKISYGLLLEGET